MAAAPLPPITPLSPALMYLYTDGSVCTFAVQTFACGNIVSYSSDLLNVTTASMADTSTDIEGDSSKILQVL